jgi:hypothetical protein
VRDDRTFSIVSGLVAMTRQCSSPQLPKFSIGTRDSIQIIRCLGRETEEARNIVASFSSSLRANGQIHKIDQAYLFLFPWVLGTPYVNSMGESNTKPWNITQTDSMFPFSWWLEPSMLQIHPTVTACGIFAQ